MRCASVQRRASHDQCQAKAICGHTLCGRHARSKTPILWIDAHRPRAPSLLRIQAVVRGFLVRRRLALAGPGVLSRGALANDEDLVNCDSKDRVHPFDYFAVEESGKVWWFSFSTLWQWASQSSTNPYTRTPLTQDTRLRLWAVWAYRSRHQTLPLPSEPRDADKRIDHRWRVLCNLFADNGFVDVHPSAFRDLTKADFLSMFQLLKRDLECVLPVSDPGRERALILCSRSIKSAYVTSPVLYTLQSIYTLMLLLTLHRNPYTVVFSILSALYRC